MLKRILFFCLAPLLAYPQISPSKYFIQFTDRNNSPYTLANPSAFLSAKAIARRAAQNIQYSQNDLPVNPQYVDSVISKGAKVLTRSKWFNGVTIYVSDSATLNAVQALPFVLSVKAVQLRKANPNASVNRFKNDVLVAEHNELMRTTESYNYGFSYSQTGMIHLDSLHAQGYDGEGMTIAVMDDGFYKVDSLAAFDSVHIHNRIIATHDFVDGDSKVYTDSVLSSGDIIHGMYTFSILAGNLPGELIGSCPKANYLLLRTENNGSENIIEEYNWNAAAEYADSAGADVFSTSLIYTTFDDASQNHTYNSMNGKTCPMTIAAEIAASKGILVVNGAGNDAAKSWKYIGTPADGDSVLTIGAVDIIGDYASFSSKGPTSDGRIKPNIAAQGAPAIGAGETGGTALISGTSFACPIIAGAAACLWQKYPNATNMQIFHAIEESANHYLTPDTLTGYGIPNFYLANILLSGIYPESISQSLNVYPSPAYHLITVSYSHKLLKAEMRIINLMGEVVMTRDIAANETIFQVNVNTLSRGIYILQIIGDEESLKTKMVKQ